MKFTDPMTEIVHEVPMVHLNGSGYDNLVNLYGGAIAAVLAAESELLMATPHPRDYYIDGDFASAIKDHREMEKHLGDVKLKLAAIITGIRAQHREKFR